MLKKAIDKVLNPGYNIRTGVEVSNREEYSFNKDITNRVFDNIKFLDEALKETVELPYVIAGGAVRDGLLGLEPRDYDIFFDMSSIAGLDEDELDDYIALLNFTFHERMGMALGGFETPWPVHNPEYENMENNFLVYEHVFRGMRDDLMAIQENSYQLIYRNNSPEIGSNPLDFVEQQFDWPLTKAFYKDDKVFVSQQFRNCMDSRVIESDDLDTSKRIRRWYDRNNTGLVGGFKLKITEQVYYGTTAASTWTTGNKLKIYNYVDQGPRIDLVANEVRQAELDREFWNQVRNNNEEAEVAPAMPEM